MEEMRIPRKAIVEFFWNWKDCIVGLWKVVGKTTEIGGIIGKIKGERTDTLCELPHGTLTTWLLLFVNDDHLTSVGDVIHRC